MGAVDLTAGAVGLLEDITVEAVAGMAAGLLPMVAWLTWVMDGAATVLTTLPIISVTITR